MHSKGPIPAALSYQLLKCGTSAAANYEEADDGSSTRDEVAKKMITLRELKETRVRLRLLRECGFLTAEQDPVIQESDELGASSQRSSETRKPARDDRSRHA